MITKIKNWIGRNFIFLITLICLQFIIQLLIKQKNQIVELQDSIDSIESEDYNKRFDEIDSKLDDVENNLGNDIDDIKRAIRYGY